MQNAIQLVTDLNNEFYEETENDEWYPFEFDTDGTEYRIMFLGTPLFSSAADYVDTRAGKTLRDVILKEMDKVMKDLDLFNRNRSRT
jgi:hypothetical protein